MRKPFRIKGRKGYFLHVETEPGKTSIRKIGNTLREANAAWELMLKRSEQSAGGAISEPGSQSVVMLISKYCDWMAEQVSQGNLAQSSLTRRINYLASFLKHIDTQLVIDDLKVFHVTEWLQERKRWNANTKYYAGVTVKRAFNWCKREGRILLNPIEFITLQKGESRDFVIDDATLSQLRLGASDPKFKRRHVIAFRVALTVLSISGCRPGEFAKLRVEDWQDDRWIIKSHKTARKLRKPRVIYLCPCLLTLSRIAAGNRTKGPLFMAAPGEAWTYSKMRRRFERLRKRIGVDPKCVLYSFRHTSITNALIAGVDVSTVAQVHGTSIQMIQSAYGHLCQHSKHLNQAVTKMARARRKPAE